MLGLIVLALLGVIVWKLWTPALSFAQGFRSLLERPAGGTGLWPFLKGVETVGGEYDGRPTLLILHHKRGRNTLGYLVVAMQPSGGTEMETRYSGAFREWIREPMARAAWDALELEHELKLSFGEGWMSATWQPHGAFIFPGQFDPERWRRVLQSMHTVVTSLERGCATPG
jgi:hypothetical protein